jgi:hypothetical protein
MQSYIREKKGDNHETENATDNSTEGTN